MLFVIATIPAGEDVNKALICAGNTTPDANTFTRIPTEAIAAGTAGATPIAIEKVQTVEPAGGAHAVTAGTGKVTVLLAGAAATTQPPAGQGADTGVPTGGGPVPAMVVPGPGITVIVGTAPAAGLLVITAAAGWMVSVMLAGPDTAPPAMVQFRTIDPVKPVISTVRTSVGTLFATQETWAAALFAPTIPRATTTASPRKIFFS